MGKCMTIYFVFSIYFSGTLSRNPSTQSDSSGFADEGDTPNSHKDSSSTHLTMVSSEAQTTFEPARLDLDAATESSYDRNSPKSRSDSVDTVLVDQSRDDDVVDTSTSYGRTCIRRVVDRRESFRKSRGTSIVTSKTFSSIDFDDDDAFILETCTNNDFPTDNDDTKLHEEGGGPSPPPLRRSGTFPKLSPKLPQGAGPRTVPEILSSLQESVKTASLASRDVSEKSSSIAQDSDSIALLAERKRPPSRLRSVDVASYPYEEHSQSDAASKLVMSEVDKLAMELGLGDYTEDESQSDASKLVSSDVMMGELDALAMELGLGDIGDIFPPVGDLHPVYDDDVIVPSSREQSECYHGNQSWSPHPVSQSTTSRQQSTQSSDREPIPQCISPTIEPWDPSEVNRYSLDRIQFPRYGSPTEAPWDTDMPTPTTVTTCSPVPEPFDNYSPLFSPPVIRTMSTETQTIASSTQQQQHTVLPRPTPREENLKSDSNISPSSDRTWQVTTTSHHLEQCRTSQGSPTPPHTTCVSELNAQCEPREEAAVTLRSSFEMEISSAANSTPVVLSSSDVERSLPTDQRHLQMQTALFISQVSVSVGSPSFLQKRYSLAVLHSTFTI